MLAEQPLAPCDCEKLTCPEMVLHCSHQIMLPVKPMNHHPSQITQFVHDPIFKPKPCLATLWKMSSPKSTPNWELDYTGIFHRRKKKSANAQLAQSWRGCHQHTRWLLLNSAVASYWHERTSNGVGWGRLRACEVAGTRHTGHVNLGVREGHTGKHHTHSCLTNIQVLLKQWPTWALLYN